TPTLFPYTTLFRSPRISAAAAAAGDADFRRIDFGAAAQIVDGANRIPRLDARRRIAARHPPPHLLAIQTVMNPLDFAELERVENDADVAVFGEPRAVMLIEGFVAVRNVVLLHLRMAADIDDGREARFDLFGQIEICRHVEMR